MGLSSVPVFDRMAQANREARLWFYFNGFRSGRRPGDARLGHREVRYHVPGSVQGWHVLETDDLTALAEHVNHWGDLIDPEVNPVRAGRPRAKPDRRRAMLHSDQARAPAVWTRHRRA